MITGHKIGNAMLGTGASTLSKENEKIIYSNGCRLYGRRNMSNIRWLHGGVTREFKSGGSKSSESLDGAGHIPAEAGLG